MVDLSMLVASASILDRAWGSVLQKYAATQKMTGSEQARSGHFCLCGYAAVRPALLPTASAGFGPQSKDCSPQSRYARRYYAALTSVSRRHFQVRYAPAVALVLSMLSVVPSPLSSGARNSPLSTSRRKASTTSAVNWVPAQSRMMETTFSKFMRLR